MGYACPVCETPQADAGHLANHLAFTAMLEGDDHEGWLDEHTPGWSEAGEDELAERVLSEAKRVEFPQVFEDTTVHEHDHRHDGEDPPPGALFDEDPEIGTGRGPRSDRRPRDDTVEEALAAAREMTESEAGTDTDTDTHTDAETGDEGEHGGDTESDGGAETE